MKGWIARKGTDFWTALVVMVFSGAVIREALDLDLGTPANPGSGFMIFGAAAVLGLMASAQCVKALFSKDQKEEEPREKIKIWRIVSVIAANAIYIAVLDRAGYILSTFILLCFLLQVYEKGKWVWAVAGAAATSVLTYLIFAKLLQLNLPQGLITFF
ncbi:MAG: tripartite tricarboxylate transporter TctB family protein [Deltaproteobacteria bacterium]